MERAAGPAYLGLILLGLALIVMLWPIPLHAQDGDAATDEDAFDIGIIIDNRLSHESEAARAEVEALFAMFDQQMFIEHIMIFERPTIEVICDVFACPEEIEAKNPFPPLLWQITREKQARVVVYYIGEGRLEGTERQLLFKRHHEAEDHDVVALSVGALHQALQEVLPKSALLMLDAGFAPGRLPCANADPRLISEALLSVRRSYQQVARRYWNAIGETIELAATTPVQVPHCDRLDRMFDGIETPLFTRFLLDGVVDGEADQDEDLLIDLGELADYLDDRIGRAVRFQWGRRQNVRAVGTRDQPLASVNMRPLSDGNAEVLERRQQPIPADEPPSEDEVSDEVLDPPGVGEAKPAPNQTETETVPEADGCEENPETADCHPCVRDPESQACADRCREEQGSDLCAADLTSGPDPVSAEADVPSEGVGIVAVPIEERSEPEDVIQERSPACRFAADTIAPFASALMERIGGGTGSSCAWALDRSDVELGPIGQIFTPVAWRLGRSYVQGGVSCLLGCDRLATSMPASERDGVEQVAWTSIEAPAEPAVDPRSFGPFKREICDQMHAPLPPYIGIPRWMPGTLIISEGLRLGFGCPPPPSQPSLPMPLVYALDVPAEPKPAEPIAEPLITLRTADERLARWSSLSADVDLPPAGEAPKSVGEDPMVERADATPVANEAGEDDRELFAEENPVEKASRIRWLQSALTLENHHPGPIDGVIGEQTEKAIRSWRLAKGRSDLDGALTEKEFQDIIETFARRFGQLRERGE